MIYVDRKKHPEQKVYHKLRKRTVDTSPEVMAEAIVEIDRLVNLGWSITVARVSVAGRDTLLWKKIASHPDYLDVLNRYMERTGQRTRYIHVDGALVAKKKGVEYGEGVSVHDQC